MSPPEFTATLKNVFPALPKTTRGKPKIISGDPKGKNFLYTNGNFVYIRDINNPSICDVYTEHVKEATVAKYAPSGFYIASADIGGKLRIWDTVNADHLLKYEYPILGGAIKDLVWSPDSKRICVAGEGREEFAKAFLWDTGSSVGSLTCHTKSVNSIDYRPVRPFRVVTASEDFGAAIFHGPPFKYEKDLRNHVNFVNTTRYSPDGNYFATGGADCMVFLYDGKDGDVIGSFGEKAHKGGVYGLCFSPDSRQLLTVSGDKTAKIWDVETRSVVTEFVMGTEVNDMQLGCLWQDDHLLTVSLSGFINYLDVNNPSKPLRILKGHNKAVTSLSISNDRSTIFTGDYDGHINYMDVNTYENDRVTGKGHSSQITDTVIDDESLITISVDDTIRFSSVSQKQYSSSSVSLDSQPKAIASNSGTTIVVCYKHIQVFKGENKVYSLPISFEGMSVAIHPGLTEVAVGGNDLKLHIYELSNNVLSERLKIDVNTEITDLKFSPDGSMLATAGASKNVKLFQLPNYPIMIDSNSHAARVKSIAWAPNSQIFATGSIDTYIRLWRAIAAVPAVNTAFRAHMSSQVNRIEWIDDNTLVSAGHDSIIKQWKISY